MDRERRYNLRRVVDECRKILEGDIAKRIAYYGILADGNSLDPSKLSHLKKAEDLAVRRRLDQAIEKEIIGGLSYKEAVARYIRHVGFTYLNRFAALRAMEVRDLIEETIIRKADLGGRSLRERKIAESNSSLSPDQVLQDSLLQAFREVGEEIKVLFDTEDEYSLVFPETRSCQEVIRLLTEEVTEDDWKQDDIIGWIYQYFNEEARKEFKKAKRKPKADDIPIINQFYTPHWVVRVLTDNTLGRLWLEMVGRCPQIVKENGNREVIERRKGIPDPKADPDKFQAWLRNPSGNTVDTFCSYVVPLKNEPPPRERKSVKEIKVLDPACGSGHFLTYAFDVLYRMYLEKEPNLPREEIPALILENNLFGIDIDLRAVQLAALSLYLKAKSYNPNLQIRKLNLICADARIVDGQKQAEFLARFEQDKPLQQIFAKLFEDLNNTNELGSLLKVREPFERLFAERGKPKGVQATFAPSFTGQIGFGKTGGITGQNKIELLESKDTNKSPIVIPRETTISEMLEELKRFEREAIERQDMGGLLFATEAEKSVGLLSLLSEKYDVVMMNPPYGKLADIVLDYIKKSFPNSKTNVYACFVDQFLDLLLDKGFIGALTERLFLRQASFSKFRKYLIKNKNEIQILLDLWYGVLEGAMNRTAAYIICKNIEGNSSSVFFNLRYSDSEEKQSDFERYMVEILLNEKTYFYFLKRFSDFKYLPKEIFAYEIPPSLMVLFEKSDRARLLIGPNAEGFQTSNDLKYVRLWWEVQSNSLNVKWQAFLKGGSPYMFYRENLYVVDITEEAIKNYQRCGSSEIENSNKLFRIGWSDVASELCFQIVPPGPIPSPVNQAVVPLQQQLLHVYLGILNTNLIRYIASLSYDGHHWQPGIIANLPVRLPVIPNGNVIEKCSKEIVALRQELSTGDETSTIFIKPWLLQVLQGFDSNKRPITSHPFAEQFEWADWLSLQEIRKIQGSKDMPLRQLAELCVKGKEAIDKRVEELQKLLDEEVYRIYEISAEDQKLIERELALRKGQALKLEGEEESEEGEEESEVEEEEAVPEDIGSKIRDHVMRLLSFYVRQAIEEDDDGIVPLDPSFDDDLAKKVRENIVRDFGSDQVNRIEREIHEILGKSLYDWLSKDYFEYHIALYKRRPIFWQLTSSRYGRSRGAGAFTFFLHYHRLTRDTIPKVQAYYLSTIKKRTQREKERLFHELEEAKAANDRTRANKKSKEYENAANILDELEEFEKALVMVHTPKEDKTKLPENASWVQRAITEVRDNSWNPIIDYGVRVNIEPLKEAKLLPTAAEKVR
jgi:hypothetical protein